MLDDGGAVGLWEVLYRWSGGDRQSDGLLKMADEWSDNDGESDGWGKIMYRWSDIDVWYDGLTTGWTGGVTDRQVE